MLDLSRRNVERLTEGGIGLADAQVSIEHHQCLGDVLDDALGQRPGWCRPLDLPRPVEEYPVLRIGDEGGTRITHSKVGGSQVCRSPLYRRGNLMAVPTQG